MIHSTVQPNTWDEVGGPGSIAKFETNLSLVISQTQEDHEEIVDLLEQLRRMQDLQVTIEVRFITLSDSFFEKIGVDFDFNITAERAEPHGRRLRPGHHRQRRRHTYNTRHYAGDGHRNVGGGPAEHRQPGNTPVYTSDLDIPFSQGNYALATPQFGSFDVTGRRPVGIRHPQRHRGVLLH